MPSKRELVTPSVIEWAINESGYDYAEIAKSLETGETTIRAWSNGIDRPTTGQLTKLAAKLKRPRSLFFRPSVPPSASLPPGLRTAAGRGPRRLFPNERLEIRRARRVQRFVAALSGHDVPPGIPMHRFDAPPSAIADSLREWSGMTGANQGGWRDAREAREAWVAAVESRRILVMQLQLGNRGLRGFSLPHPVAPVVAVGTAQNDGARIFTLWHEVAHLAMSAESSCLSVSDLRSRERFFDEVAGLVLIPEDALRAACKELAGPDRFEQIAMLADRFGTSLRATAVALIRSGVGDESDYALVQSRAPTGDTEKPQGFGRGSTRRAQRRLREIGVRAAQVVSSALESGEIPELAARRVLRLDGHELAEMSDAVR